MFKFRFIVAICYLFKLTYGSSPRLAPPGIPHRAPPPAPVLQDFTTISRASQHNTDHAANIIAFLKGAIAQRINDIESILNAIIAGVSENMLGLNRRNISDDLGIVGGTITDTNSKSKPTQDSLNDVNGITNSIRSLTNSFDGKTDEIKGITEEMDRKIASTGTTSNNILDRIGPIRDNINSVTSRIDSTRLIVFDQDGKVDQTLRLTDALTALTNLMIQRFDALGLK